MYLKQRSEATEQESVIQWCLYRENQYPELKNIFHVPNGGSRNKIEAANLKRQGVKAGVPDLVLAVPKGIYHGLFIEMKWGKNRVQDSQKEWLKRLEQYGYYTKVCYGAEAAIEKLEKYLNLTEGQRMEEKHES